MTTCENESKVIYLYYKIIKMIKSKIYLLSIIILSVTSSCHTQTKKNKMDTKSNKNFVCETKTGVCTPTNDNTIEEINLNKQEKVKLIYYTDPICSACWAIEPELKKFKLEYGDFIDIEYRMGGLLPNWDGFNDAGNGISKPSDVAPHWDEVGEHSGMSIDGDIWFTDPLSSSYPPSVAFEAMKKQGKAKSLLFLRYMREMLFLEKKNITKEAFLLEAVKKCKGDPTKFLLDYHSDEIKQNFQNKIAEGKNMGVRGFPTFIFVGKKGTGFKMSGMSGYKNYILALEKAFGEKITPKPILFTELTLLKEYGYLATKEISFILSQEEEKTILNLKKLVKEGVIKKEEQKFGFFWRFID